MICNFMIFLEYVGSRAPLSAKLMKVIKRSDFFPVFLFYRVRADSVDEGSIGKPVFFDIYKYLHSVPPFP